MSKTIIESLELTGSNSTFCTKMITSYQDLHISIASMGPSFLGLGEVHQKMLFPQNKVASMGPSFLGLGEGQHIGSRLAFNPCFNGAELFRARRVLKPC